ncbi:hypothetical protein SNEBB_004248 [Seison nebaliae]|nr:hypothetical protein SNEBB_004248 [Seison nebaliae]
MKFLCIVLISIFCISVNCTIFFTGELKRVCSTMPDNFSPSDPAIEQTMIDLEKALPFKEYDIDSAPSFAHACAAMNRLVAKGTVVDEFRK